MSTAIADFVHEEAARQGIELSIPDPPRATSWQRRADALGMLPSDIARKAENARMGLTLEARAYRASSSTLAAPPLEV